MPDLDAQKIQHILIRIMRRREWTNTCRLPFDPHFESQFIDLYSFMLNMYPSYARIYPVEMYYDIYVVSPHNIRLRERIAGAVFKGFYRIDVKTFNLIVDRCKASNQFLLDIPIDMQIATVFWRCTNTHFGSLIITRSGISSTALETIRKTFIQVIREQSGGIIRWPYRNIERARDISNGFRGPENLLEGVIGVIYCKQIVFRRPQKETSFTLIDEEKKDDIHVNVFGVFDHKGRFNYLHADDAMNGLHSSLLLKGLKRDPKGMFPGDTYLIADSSLLAVENIIPPYKSDISDSPEQIHFNDIHFRTKKKGYRSYRDIHSRWKFLWAGSMGSNQFVVETFIVCCLLHNICVSMDDQDSVPHVIFKAIIDFANKSAIEDEYEVECEKSLAAQFNTVLQLNEGDFSVDKSVQPGLEKRRFITEKLYNEWHLQYYN